MATLKELEQELRIEKNKTKALEELREIGAKRKNIKKEIKSLRRGRKFAGAVEAGRAIRRGASAIRRATSAGVRALNAAEKRRLRERLAKSKVRGKPGKTLARQSSFERTIMEEIPL